MAKLRGTSALPRKEGILGAAFRRRHISLKQGDIETLTR
jgi:hypothetical protein